MRYRMEGGTIIETDKASAHWNETTRWNGSNHISVPTGSQWLHETLYRSRKGRYYVEHCSQYQGSTPHCEWVSPQEAARWLLHQGIELPDDLKQHEEEVTE
jgi:hypothetical protein